MSEDENQAGVHVEPDLDWHDVGCVKRYGAISDGPCECEKRRALKTSDGSMSIAQTFCPIVFGAHQWEWSDEPCFQIYLETAGIHLSDTYLRICRRCMLEQYFDVPAFSND